MAVAMADDDGFHDLYHLLSRSSMRAITPKWSPLAQAFGCFYGNRLRGLASHTVRNDLIKHPKYLITATLDRQGNTSHVTLVL